MGAQVLCTMCTLPNTNVFRFPFDTPKCLYHFSLTRSSHVNGSSHTLSLMWHSTPPVEGQERVVDLFSWWRVMFSSWSLLDSTVRFFTKESTQQEEGMVNVRGGAHRSSMHWWTVWTVIRYPVVKSLNPTSVSCWWYNRSSRHFIAAERLLC